MTTLDTKELKCRSCHYGWYRGSPTMAKTCPHCGSDDTFFNGMVVCWEDPVPRKATYVTEEDESKK
jgi:RNA polymerase subunit RPABC4/transcription elongation factor Spt4